jgi:hypothetical protein
MGLFDTLTAIPCAFVQGEAPSWNETLSEYPCASYAVAYKFEGDTPLDGIQQFSVVGTESDSATYTFQFAANVKPGVYRWEKQITRSSDSRMAVAECGMIIVRPNAATVQTTTTAAANVASIEASLATLAASTNASVSFNGQSFTQANVGELQRHLAYWKSRALKERRALDALLGLPTQRGFIRFA